MRKQIVYLSFIVLLASLQACSSPEEKLLKKIKALETEIYGNPEVMTNHAKIKELAFMYVDYAALMTDSLKAADYLFRAGDLSMNSGNPEHAIEMFSRIRKDYPDYVKSPESLFLMAFVYDNYLRNYPRAEELYSQFINQYPDHELVDDAQMLLQYLGMSPEDLLKVFEEKQKEQAGL